MIRCEDVMRSQVATCRESDPVGWAAALMRDFDCGFLPVADANGMLVGVVTERDLASRVVAEGRSPTADVAEVMTRDVLCCRPDDDARVAEEQMLAARRSRLPVVDANGACVGVLSLADVARVDRLPREGAWLHDIARRERILVTSSVDFTT